MKIIYKDCEIEVFRDKCLAGYDLLYYNIFTKDGYEITSSFSDSDETIKSMIEDCKSIVDDYLNNPEDYE